MHNPSQTGAIILAGGTSSRMGAQRNKLLLPLNNRPVLAHVIEAALGSQARPIVLVLGHQAAEVKAHIQQDLQEDTLEIVENPAYAQGQSTSMQAGLRALLSEDHRQNLANVIFLLGDQPMITPAMIDELITLREQSGKLIALPLYHGQRGNPVVFSLELAPELLQVRGDEGGRSVLKRHPDEIATLEMGNETANFDVDTWEAYQEVQAAWQLKMLE
ncbi:MAG TPA: nucleotidyltransferase family protein [Ktedonobacteraceae bacterium]|nr:nucleotidyltransferase family protein [Ktedonobacteraceae bacterium]